MVNYYEQGEQIKDYSILDILGEGRYGIVYLAKNTKDEKCIIKLLKKDMLKKSKSKLFYEQEILKSLNSPKFPQFIEYLEIDNLPAYVLEYIPGIVFEDLLADDSYLFRKEQIFEIAIQLVEIISILQQNNIVHRDIRPPNVLIKENQDIVLIDFGLARYIDDKKYTKQVDYWYLGDFLIHLYYTSFYQDLELEERPWYEELDITEQEILFLKKLMGIEDSYTNIEEIQSDIMKLKIQD
ncbi:serine/threonine-protein kinase PknB [Anaerotignum neopropionicum]|uniref:Serine/threonine-protein kinase PknB n=1 Tax=Anaerotignum neopropionicum TaxID=36847 RepID=A0A136WHK5_9FIRM|nr:protein kinase [Anaerotignum neopropionicum]KXL54011.1 serine/threonine-protein kinase PknB [Anaerotignum neopropionicum]